jgi:Fe-S-cluster containining protein
VNKVTDFLDDGKWKCTACGACCSYIAPLVANGKLPKKWLKPDGSCVNLNGTKCEIYEKRPEICRVDKTLKNNFSDLEIAQMCKVMKDHKDKIYV